MWDNQAAYVEFWIEKDALAGVFNAVTDAFDVPLYVARGYSSDTYLYQAAEELRAQQATGKAVFVYHWGDYDASGRGAARDIRDKLREFGAEFEFIEAAVTEAQITELNLQTRPAKTSDPRSKNWRSAYAVDLDAIPPATLRQMARNAITQHIDPDEWHMMERVEKAEQAQFLEFIGGFSY